jgi:PKD repeat protein
MQKLNEAGYEDIQIVNSTDRRISVIIGGGISSSRGLSSSNNNDNAIAATTVPAKLVEITYRTNSAPNQIRTGYFMLTATAATPRNLGTITGYSLFYEGNSIGSSNTTTTTTISSDSLASPRSLPTGTSTTTSSPTLLSPPAPVRQVFDSFQLIAATPAEPLRVEITSSDTEGVAPATFRFEAHVTGGMEPYTYSWSFGDGSSSRQERGDDTVRHTFDRAGTYNVRVIVTDSTGRTVSDSILITVEAPPPLTGVDIISNGTEGVAPATFRFEANVTGGTEPYTYSWSFGDGSSSRQEREDDTVRHTFDRAGTYNVDVTVTDSTGRTAFDNIKINVKEAPVAEQPPNVHNFLDDLIDELGLS